MKLLKIICVIIVLYLIGFLIGFGVFGPMIDWVLGMI